MKKTLSILLLSAVLAAGCGNSGNDFVSTSNGVNANNFELTAAIPPGGGQVALPAEGGIAGSLIFDPGAVAGSRISMTSTLQPPQGVDPLGVTSAQVNTKHHFFLTFTVSHPTPLALLEGVRLEGAGIPLGHDHYHANLYQVGGVMGQAAAATHLQEFPGEHDGSGVTYDEIQDGTTLQPGTTYAMGFKSTDQQTLEFKVVNNSGISPCYVFIKGQNPTNTEDKRFYYVNKDGELVPMDLDDLGPDKTADYNILVPENGIIKLPLVLSGRLYISLGEKIKTQLFPPVHPTDPPALWAAPDGWSNPAEPNFKTLWDFVEFDYKVSPDSGLPGMGVNTTQVQMTGIPTQLELEGPTHEPLISGAKGDGTRTALLQGLNDSPVFKTLIVEGTATNTNVSPLRVISADNGIRNTRNNIPGVPHFDAEFYDSYIDQVWEKYKTEDLTMKTSAFGTYLGRVNAQNQMIFTQAGKRSVTVPKPDSTSVIVGDGALFYDMPNAKTPEEIAVVGEIGSTMSACFNRTTLLVLPEMIRNPQDFDPANFALFYANEPTNLYSELNHNLSLPTAKAPLGGAYGFGYDDNLDQSSVIIDNKAPTSMTVTIPAF